MQNDLVDMLVELEREVRDLKSVGQQSGLLKCYSKALTKEEVEKLSGLKWTIYYGEGEQPIVSEIYTGMLVTPFKPDEKTNTQLIHIYTQSYQSFTIIATRPILKIEGTNGVVI